jgi:membrane protease YdiL (CAAX protease family)
MTYPVLKALGNPASYLRSMLLLLGFLVALILRLTIGGVSVAQSLLAGLVFAACLILLSVSVGTKTRIDRINIFTGIFGGIFLIIPAIIIKPSALHPSGNYLSWAAAVTIIAFAEEAFFRGALFDSLKEWGNETTAVIIAAVAFAALHIPLYGWKALPLDFAVGLFLGSLRVISRSWVAPGIAHTMADLIGWWL